MIAFNNNKKCIIMVAKPKTFRHFFDYVISHVTSDKKTALSGCSCVKIIYFIKFIYKSRVLFNSSITNSKKSLLLPVV